MRILLIDNYDSFTHNLYHLLSAAVDDLTVQIDIIKNDRLTPAQAAAYEKIVISPGPGLPCEAGDLMAVIDALHATHPILGICLGHQALAEYFGARLYQLPQPIHGGTSSLHTVAPTPIFRDLPSRFAVARYHSWAIDPAFLPASLVVTAMADEVIMAFSHVTLPIHGLQFHPESFCTEYGVQMIRNFLYC